MGILDTLVNRILDRQERRLGHSMDWLRELHRASPRGFRRFVRTMQLVYQRDALPNAVWAAAHLTAVRFEDCGPCVQIGVDLALRHGVDPVVIHAVLAADDSRLPDEVALARRFTSAVCERSPETETLRAEVRSAWGRRGEADLACSIVGARAIPMMKRALGHAVSCSGIEFHGLDPADDSTLRHPGHDD